MMPPLKERTNDKQARNATMWKRLILARLIASETMMPYNEPSPSALLCNRGRDFVIYISFFLFSVTSRAKTRPFPREKRRLLEMLSCSILRELPLPYSEKNLRPVSACPSSLSHDSGSYR